MRNHSYENVFHLQVHFHANQTCFHKKSFALRLILRQRQTRTRKWAIKETDLEKLKVKTVQVQVEVQVYLVFKKIAYNEHRLQIAS